MRSDVPRCGLMWFDAVIRPTANFYLLQFSNVMCSGFSTAIALCFRVRLSGYSKVARYPVIYGSSCMSIAAPASRNEATGVTKSSVFHWNHAHMAIMQIKLCAQRNDTGKKQFQSHFETVLFQFHFLVPTVLCATTVCCVE